MNEKMEKCEGIKNLLPLFLDKELQDVENKEVECHLSSCLSCKEESILYQKSWEMLKIDKNIDPQPGYMTRFWTEISSRKTWSEKIGEFVKELLWFKRLVPAFATVCILVVMSIFSFRNYYNLSNSQNMLASLSLSDLEMVEYVELAENWELIRNIDFYEDMDIIENSDISELG